MGRIVLCADSESLRHPELMGLDGESVEALPWLECFASAGEARRFACKEKGVDEVWVVSSDDMEGINVAAAMRQDDPGKAVYLVLFEASGSVLSRAQAARVTGTLTRQTLTQRFALEKRRHARRLPAGAGERAAAAGADVTPGVNARAAAAPGASVEAAAGEAAAPGASAGAAVEMAAGADAAPRLAAAAGAGESAVPAAFAGAPAERSAFVLTVVSGSGGAGKSSVATLAACLACERGLRTLLLDGDLQFGDLHHLTGLEPAATLDELIAQDGAEVRLGVKGQEELVLVGAPQRLEQADAVARELPALLRKLARSFDVIVVNTGASWADYHVVLLEQSSCALFLVDQRASSVRACQHALELCARCGIATGSFAYVLNRCGKGAPFTSIDVSCALQGAHVAELAEGGHVVEELLGAGYPSELVASANPFCASVERLLDELLPEVAAAQGLSRGAARGQRAKWGGTLSRRSRRRAHEAPASARALAGIPADARAGASAVEEVGT
ncbi:MULTISPECIES: chromosome partitioning protein ParA [unclassified Adlercreutzia]|uniref:AAA family ATPase n=1 Tax=unclassified Adlercreutzia TaxID=2636013 RepID=UPI0013EA362D|nr:MULTISPECIES: chromosome partitioning protein ParA [unclassified Adlercreutzia]